MPPDRQDPAVVDGFYSATWTRGPQRFTCGFVVLGGIVSPEIAPVLRWAIGKPAPTLRRWVEGKGGQVKLIAEQGTLV